MENLSSTCPLSHTRDTLSLRFTTGRGIGPQTLLQMRWVTCHICACVQTVPTRPQLFLMTAPPHLAVSAVAYTADTDQQTQKRHADRTQTQLHRLPAMDALHVCWLPCAPRIEACTSDKLDEMQSGNNDGLVGLPYSKTTGTSVPHTHSGNTLRCYHLAHRCMHTCRCYEGVYI